MGKNIANHIWSQLNKLELSSTESFVLLSLAFFASDDFGYCHPRQRQLAQKTGLGATAIKESLSSLKSKGLIKWAAKPKHPNEYTLLLDGPDNANTHNEEIACTPKENTDATIEGAACTLLAQSFAALLADSKRRFAASLDYTKPVKQLGFLTGFRLLFRIRPLLKGLTDDEIHERILKALAQTEQERKPNG